MLNKYALIEEAKASVLSRAKKLLKVNVEKFLNLFKSKIKNKSSKQLNEATEEATKNKKTKIPTPIKDKNIGGKINITDTCFTSIMKIIQREDLNKKYDHSAWKFIKDYYKHDKPIKITKHNVDLLQKGVVIIMNHKGEAVDNSYFSYRNNNFDIKKGLYSDKDATHRTAGHFGIIIDPKKYLVLHARYSGAEGDQPHIIGGSGLDLYLQKMEDVFKDPEDSKIYALDAKVLNKM